MSQGDPAAIDPASLPAEIFTEPTRLGARAWALATAVFCFALCCYVPMLGETQISGTEAHRAITAHQMVESGEWLVPRMFEKIYLAKPPLHYWILASLEKLTGSATPFIWRLPAAIEGAMIATVLCLFGYRWFGELGGAVAGFAYAGMVTMWGEHRGAELDATNTLTATIAALCLIELHFAAPKRRGLWIIAAGLAAGASFMVKGPASLTILLGVTIFAGIDAARRRRIRELARPAMWLPLLIGAAIFGAYALAVHLYLKAHHLPPDLTGVQEGYQDSHPLTLARFEYALTLPAILFAYALPVSLALLINFLPGFAETIPNRRRLSSALAFSVLCAWGVCALVGMHNPRYGFITLPLLCPLAGAIASRHPKFLPRENNTLRTIVIGVGVGYAAAAIAMSISLAGHVKSSRALIAIAILTLIVLAAFIYHLAIRHRWRSLPLLLTLIVLASLAFAIMKNRERIQHSCQAQADMLRQTVGPNGTLATNMMVLDQPDLFFFSRVPTKGYDGDQLDWGQITSRQWVVLEKPEFDVWRRDVPGRLLRVYPFVANSNPGWLVLYDPAAAEPSTAPIHRRGGHGGSGRHGSHGRHHGN